MKVKLSFVILFFTILLFLKQKNINNFQNNNLVNNQVVNDQVANDDLFKLNYDIVKYKNIPSFSNHKTSEEIDSLAWYRFKSNNTYIHSLDENQGQEIINNFEKIQNEFNEYLSIESVGKSIEVKIFCLPSVQMMNKFFGLDSSAVQYSKENKSIYAWLILDNNQLSTLRSAICSIELQKIEIESGKMNFWAQRGMSVIFKDPDQTRNFVKNGNYEQISFQDFVTLDKIKYLSLDQELKISYDIKSVFLCLMLKKEFGKSKLKTCMVSGSEFYSELGFKDSSSFEEKYNLYCEYLYKDILANKTPDDYLK